MTTKLDNHFDEYITHTLIKIIANTSSYDWKKRSLLRLWKSKYAQTRGSKYMIRDPSKLSKPTWTTFNAPSRETPTYTSMHRSRFCSLLLFLVCLCKTIYWLRQWKYRKIIRKTEGKAGYDPPFLIFNFLSYIESLYK